MKSAGAAALLLAASAIAVPERWLHNPRERTERAVSAWRRGDFTAAQQALQQALELGGENSRLEYNAGSGHLAAGTPGTALPLLQRAAERPLGVSAADWQALRPDAFYNLGNAQLAAGEVEAAIEAYRACLRIAPDHQPAKHNLELALRQQPQPPPPPRGGAGESAGGGTPPDPRGQGGGQGEGQDQGEGEQGGDGQPGEADPQQGQPPPAADGRGGQQKRSPRLPDFDPQEDMSAEQAAALLEAVENLEREQRRAQAEELRRRRARQSGERDW